ncbi:MAG: STAS domain-containing protein [Phycisphaerae bacterium]|jgi:stage II sporulation protein AA (anti-sigma F factor antagonist)
MTVQEWSDSITVVDLADDPQFTDDLAALAEALTAKPVDVVLDCSAMGFIDSSNLARLLRLRKQLTTHGHHLILCGVTPHVHGIFHVTGLDRIFKFTQDMATALATLQLSSPQGQSQTDEA